MQIDNKTKIFPNIILFPKIRVLQLNANCYLFEIKEYIRQLLTANPRMKYLCSTPSSDDSVTQPEPEQVCCLLCRFQQ